MAESTLEAAIKYHKQGFFVVPVAAGTKQPLVKWGQGSKRMTIDGLKRLWAKQTEPPDVALKLDKRTMILDLDPRHNPKVTELFGDLREQTMTSETPSGGLHAWYVIDEPLRPKAFTGLDVLTEGRIVVVPPSAGRAWSGADKIMELEKGLVTPVIQAVTKAIGVERETGEGLGGGLLSSLDDIPYHRRNQTLTAIAGVLRGVGFRGNRLTAVLAGLAEHVTEQPDNDRLTMEDIERISESIDWRRPKPFDTNDFTRYEFNTKETPPILRWLIRGFLPGEGVTSLFGLGKQGKSYIAMELLRCLSLDQPFMELESVGRPIKVLYVDWEKRGNSLKRRLHAMAAKDAIPVTVMEPHGDLFSMVEALRAQVEIGGFEFVIIDSLTIAIMRGDVNEAATVVPALFALNSIGVPVLTLDHTKKPQFGEPYESLTAYGSVFKANVASMNWRLRKINGDAAGMDVVLQHVSNNYEVDPPDIYARIGFTFDSYGQLETASVVKSSVDPSDNKVWRYLSNQVEPEDEKNLAKTLMMSLPETRRALAKLKEAGYVANTGGPEWWVARLQDADEENE